MVWFEAMEAPDPGYIAFLDVLGLSHRLEVKPLASNVIELRLLRSLINQAAHFRREEMHDSDVAVHFMALSDSVILWPHANDVDALVNLVQRVEFLLRRAAESGIFLRGAITRGELFVSDDRRILTGKALARAAALEKKQKWSGVVVDDVTVGLSPAEQHSLDTLVDGRWLTRIRVPGLEGDPRICINWVHRCQWPASALKMTHGSVNPAGTEDGRRIQEQTFAFFEKHSQYSEEVSHSPKAPST